MVLLLSLGGLFTVAYKRSRITAAVLLSLGTAWVAISATAGWLFPLSLTGRWVSGVIGGLIVVAAGLPLGLKPSRAGLLAATTGCLAGVGAAISMRAPEPTTQPLANPVDWVAEPDSPLLAESRDGTVRGRFGEVRFACTSLLTFDRASPDRFLSLFAPPYATRPVGTIDDGVIRYPDGTALRLRQTVADGRIEMAAQTPVDVDTYTHLNTYAHLDVRGLKNPRLRFSACGEDPVEVRFADYPTGRSARFACLMPGDELRVFEATSGEKGPFTTLSSGQLLRHDPLTLEIMDGGTAIFSWTLNDWAAQASTALSPTAGWHIPQNAIEFQRIEPDGHLEIWVTLAATSVGRGWDTVGHRAGVYSNTNSIEPAIAATE